MSHVMTLKLEVKNPDLFVQVARDLGLEVLGHGQHKLYYSREFTGQAIRLPGWTYPVILDDQGQIHYDNYKGHWGDIAQLNELTQRYVAETVMSEARMQGRNVWESVEEDGTLVLTVGGGW